MSAALGLFRLQQIDRQLDQAQSRLSVIHQTLENDSELRSALEQVKLAEAAHRQSEAALRDAETNVKGQRVKIEQAESSLYGGHVHNPKELQDLQNDIASLKRFLSTLEERQFDVMLEVETALSTLKAAEAALGLIQAHRGDEHLQLIGEQASITKLTERLQAERQAAVSDISNQLIETYDRLRQSRRGVAVAEVNDNTCSACGTTLNAALQQSARSATQISNCSSCGRILYAS
jgi:predicted  nucleic acid-binding Zn-ribbon protein